MTHCVGGFSLSAYCMPQAVQMKKGMRFPWAFVVWWKHCGGFGED
jgi:hypothetical protein